MSVGEFGGDAEPCLAHEGGREGEGEGLLIEARERHLAALGKMPDERVEKSPAPLASQMVR
jgi:hypothetical protein